MPRFDPQPDNLRGNRRRGLTLAELLIVLAIIGVLIGLLIPAVQAVRERSNRLSCANHLRQMGLALLMHHNIYHVFPSNGGWDGKQKSKDVSCTTPRWSVITSARKHRTRARSASKVDTCWRCVLKDPHRARSASKCL